MKRSLTILLSALLLFILSACDDNINSNTISVAELTDRESAILSSSSEQLFVFDFKIKKNTKKQLYG